MVTAFFDEVKQRNAHIPMSVDRVDWWMDDTARLEG